MRVRGDLGHLAVAHDIGHRIGEVQVAVLVQGNGLGFRVSGLGLGFRVPGLGYKATVS